MYHIAYAHTVSPLCTASVCTCNYIHMYIATWQNRISGTAAITNRMATVTINDLQCGVTYNITAEGALNGTFVGPGSLGGNIATGPCPVITSECIRM